MRLFLKFLFVASLLLLALHNEIEFLDSSNAIERNYFANPTCTCLLVTFFFCTLKCNVYKKHTKQQLSQNRKKFQLFTRFSVDVWFEHIAMPIYNYVSRPRNVSMQYTWIENLQRMIHNRQITILDSILRWSMRYSGISTKAIQHFFDQCNGTISLDFQHINMIFLKYVSYVCIYLKFHWFFRIFATYFCFFFGKTQQYHQLVYMPPIGSDEYETMRSKGNFDSFSNVVLAGDVTKVCFLCFFLFFVEIKLK